MQERPSFKLFYWVLAWMSVFPVMAVIVSGALFWFGPKVAHGPAACYLNPTHHNEFSTIKALAYINHAGAWTHAVLEIHATDSSTYAGAEIDLLSMNVISAYSDFWGSGQVNASPPVYAQPHPLTEAEVLMWLGYVDADISQTSVQDSAVELATILRTIPKHGLAGLTPKHFEYVSRGIVTYWPAIWFVNTVLVFWFVVWVLGFGLLWRMRRKDPSNQTDCVRALG